MGSTGLAQRPQRARPRKTVVMVPRRPLRTVLLALLVLALLAAGGVAVWRELQPVPPVGVPDVVGRDVSAAHELLVAQGFAPMLAPAAPSDAAAFTVIATDPPAGTLLDGGAPVRITFSAGPPDVVVPEVAGLDVLAAEEAVRSAGLEVGPRTEQPDADVPAGAVVRADPPPGVALPRAVPIALVVSSGPPPVVLPLLAGLPENVAVDQLRQAGLAPQVVRHSSPTVPVGEVIGQAPEAGLEVPPGTAVTVFSSTGPA